MEALDHLGIAVEDLEWVLAIYRKLLPDSDFHIEEVPSEKVKIGSLKIGDVTLEFLQAMDPESPVGKFLAKKGQGIHHLALRVQNIEKTILRLKESGFEFTTDSPRVGSEGKRIIFLHPRSTAGILVELCSMPGG